MSILMREPYAPRPVRGLGTWEIGAWRLKVYGIAYGRERAREELVGAARGVVERYLAGLRERHATYGVGFVGVHDGRGESQVFLSRWANENELQHMTWVGAVDRRGELRVSPPDQNVACVWDLAVMCFERQAWVDEVLRKPDGGAIERYMARRMDAMV